MAKKMTVRDIAKAAGVSVATVSRVLNSLSGFSPETERLVQETAGRMGYRIPERKAQSRETEAIALVIPAVNEYFSGSLTRSVENAARKRGYVVILCNAGCDAMYGEEFVGLLKKKLVKGIVACSIPPDSALLRVIWEAKLPCVLIDSVSYEYTFPYVKIDDFQGMYAATKFLLDCGHRRIAILSGAMEDQVAGGPRMEGYRQALRDAGIAPSAMAAIHQIAVRLPPRPTGTVFRMTFVGVKEDFVLPPVIMTGEYCTSSSTPQSGHRTTPFSRFFPHFGHIIEIPFLSAEQGVRCENPFHTNLHLQYSRVPRKYNSLSE